MDKVLLIDGHNAMWRASIGFAPKKAKVEPTGWEDNGQPNMSTNDEWTPDPTVFTDVQVQELAPIEEKPDYTTIFNFFRNLRPIIEQFEPDKCFFVLEGHAKFRYDLFPEYKANRLVKTASRQEELDRFHPQKEIIIKLMKYLPITTVRADSYEADDVVATLARGMPDEDVTILSNDTDFIQLLQLGLKNLQIYNPISKKFAVDPGYHYVAWKCLRGDTSDNIPGFKGIGDKTAQKMLADPKKFADFMALEENRANFNIYKQLIELRTVPLEELIVEEGKTDWPALKHAFTQMEFNSIVNDKSWQKYTETFSCLKY